ncbi:MAG: succinate dehydrogenase cytochrome b subunit [Proteobacteria bacterium]|nr:succinate dehydrogenase cytochrome b subunit [Pseudomonadota bacterium]
MWPIKFISSSIGKKIIMAVSGLFLILFLCTHALGNAAIFVSSHAFQTYADALHSLPIVVLLFGLGLLVILLFHIGFGINLFLQNKKAGGSRYAVNTRVIKNSFASKTMPYSGLCILLFILIHVFGFNNGPADIKISQLVKLYLSEFFYSVFYIFSFCALALHLSHGFWSMLQTFGINHPRYNNGIAKLTLIVPAFFLLFFSGIALYFLTGLGASY